MSKAVKTIIFTVVSLILVIGIVIAVITISDKNSKVDIKISDDNKEKLNNADYEGKVYAVLSLPEGAEADSEDFDSAVKIIEKRLVGYGAADFESKADFSAKQIIISFLPPKGEKDFDSKAVVEELSKTGMLSFREGGTSSLGQGQTYENLPLILDGNDVESAAAYYDIYTKDYSISITFKESGAEKFSEVTERLAASRGIISIWMDDELLCAPQVAAHITEGSAAISGDFTVNSAKKLADKINSGALPFKLEISEFHGENASQTD